MTDSFLDAPWTILHGAIGIPRPSSPNGFGADAASNRFQVSPGMPLPPMGLLDRLAGTDLGNPAPPSKTGAEQDAALATTIDTYLAQKTGSPLQGLGPLFVKYARRYDLDPRLMVAIAGAESSFGKNLRAGANNPFGLLYNGYNSDYPDWEHAINALGKSLSHGYDLSSTDKMYRRYCQSGNCDAGLGNIDRFMRDQGADPTALRYPQPTNK